MPLIPGAISNKLKTFILELNAEEQKDKNVAIDRFCQEIESDIYKAIRSTTIVFPPGSIIVLTGTGPATNPQPIIIQNALK